MNLGRLIWREILHRKLGFGLSVATVSATIGCLVAVAALLGSHDIRTSKMLDDMNAETERAQGQFEKETRAHDLRTSELLDEMNAETIRMQNEFEKEVRSHDLRTSEMLSEMNATTARMQAKLAADMKAYEDSVRKTMKGLGFNVYIFPEGQELSEVYSQGFASKTMPEDYVNTLANSKIVTVNHLLPTLTRKLKWPEEERTVILIGIRGEVPLAHRDPKKPLIDPVKKGHLVLGYELHRSLGLSEGNATNFMGRKFKVEKCHSERGSKDDITIWMHLSDCQELLKEKGRINAIKALECNCASIDRLGEIRREIAKLLPGTKVIETESKALVRAEARIKAKKFAEDSIKAKQAASAKLKEDRERLRTETKKRGLDSIRSKNQETTRLKSDRERLLVETKKRGLDSIRSKNEESKKLQKDRKILRSENKENYGYLIGVVALAAIASVGFLAFANARDRQAEIGVLRAMGTSTGTILGALLSRAFLVGLIGAGSALVVAFIMSETLRDGVLQGFDLRSLREHVPLLVISVPILTCAASWLPALHAASQDPAAILRNE
jgi:putative ABC transport system permease protein